MHVKHSSPRRCTRGFSLVEVLVALLVISIGLLGIAKMQALALSNTNGGRLRALAAIEAASLASTMQADRNYWGNVSSALTVSVSTSSPTSAITMTSSDSNFPTTVPSCLYAGSYVPCTPIKMAAYDLNSWATDLQSVLPVSAASITCTALTTTPPAPVSCQIQINWVEQNTLANTTETTTGMASPSYTLFVNP
jgi:type IV pilus assembly protein PilV